MKGLYQVSVFSAKPLIVLIFLVIAFRLLGKRAAAQMSVYDLAMVMALANAVQNAMTAGKGDLSVGLAASGTLIVAAAGITWLTTRSSAAERICVGTPTVVLSKGRMLRSRLRKELLTEDELMAALREHGLKTAADAEMAVLEVDGTLSIVPKENLGGRASSPHKAAKMAALPEASSQHRAKSKDSEGPSL